MCKVVYKNVQELIRVTPCYGNIHRAVQCVHKKAGPEIQMLITF